MEYWTRTYKDIEACIEDYTPYDNYNRLDRDGLMEFKRDLSEFAAHVYVTAWPYDDCAFIIANMDPIISPIIGEYTIYFERDENGLYVMTDVERAEWAD